MIPYDRRRLCLVILVGLAIFVGGTALAAHGSLSPTGRVSAARRSEKARSVTQASLATPAEVPDDAKPARRQFTVYRNPEGETVCREATRAEIARREQDDLEGLGLRKINHLEISEGKSSTSQSPEATNLIIVLRGTQQLQQNQAATAAFTRAAQNWESLIMSPVTIYIDVDYGTKNFGQTWPTGVLGATSAPSSSYPYQSVRANLIAEATGEGNATKQAIFNALPANSVPTDLGDASATDVSDPTARAIGLLPATAQPTDAAARIAFNSNFTFDFDPSDGINASDIDFDAVATHEIGHALGFDSDAGLNAAKPSVWDLYRFRTGTTASTFSTAQRILTIGGAPDPLQFDFVPGNAELGLSTGGPAGSSANGGDGWQSSHWKHVANCFGAIGIMDPAIPNGCRRTITSNDTLALTSFGYNLTNSNPPPPPPPAPTPPANDNFVNAQTISGCSGSVSGSSFGATSEAGEPSHDPPDTSSFSPTHTVWYQWQAPSSGSTTITTNGSDFDTILAVYTGSSVGSLTRLVFNDDVQNGVIRTSTVTFSATAGTTYRIVVDGWGGDAGVVKLNWTGCGTPSPTPTPTATPTPTPTPTATPTPTPTPVTGPCPGAAGYTVNSTADGPDLVPGDGVCRTASGVCTLRAAVQEENAMSGCGVMDLNLNSVTGTISLATPLPNIQVHTHIKGPGAGQLTVQRSSSSGTPNFRIFTIDGDWSVTMSGLTISNGNAGNDESAAGGGIFNVGSLTMTDCNVYGNVAGIGGGIFNAGSLTLLNCNIGANGPGQPNIAGFGAGLGSTAGSVKIKGGLISGNDVGTSASGGGGIGITGGGLTLDGVAITNNKSNAGGGGLKILAAGPFSDPSGLLMTNCLVANNGGGGSGGGLFVNAGNVNFANVIISNSTISGNTSFDGGGISNSGGILVINSTITDNRTTQSGTGLVTCDSCTVLRNSIVARNLQGGIPNTTAGDIFGRVDPTSAFNLVGSCNFCGLTSGLNHNQVGVSEPRLGALANNGGSTMTHALLAGSPAIDAGNNSLALSADGFQLTSDQRGPGFNRIIGSAVDIGAFEVQTALQQNPIDLPDFFVKQQYLDFLNRQPDQSGLDFWTNQITSCGSDAQCIEAKRINVSAAFFLSIEFQQTGNLVYKMYKAGFGNLTGKPVAVDRAPFLADTRQIQTTPTQVIVGQGDWQTQLETNKQAFALAFVQRSAFQSAHGGQDAATYVNSLFANAGVTPIGTETSAAINAFNSAGGGDAGRASALRSVADSNSVSNKLFNEAFVLMQYFGYLQRNPYDPPELTLNYQGYNFWLNKLNQFNGNYIDAEMVKAFLASSEYRQRFGP